MSSFSQRFKTNKEMEKDGIWFTVHQNDDGSEVQFRIRRSGTANSKYLKEVEKLTRPYRAMKQIPTELVIELSRKAYKATCINDWRNVDMGTGELPFTKDNLDAICEELPDVLDLLMTVSDDASYFQDTTEDDIKN